MRQTVILLTLLFTSNAFGAVPALVMPSDDGGEAVVLSSMDVKVTIRGHLARTEYDLTFRNNLDRIVGGDFVFPVPPDGEVSALGLYFDGKLRRAAAVERVLAKTAYEGVVHRRVDPALAEWTDSRAFRMRLYPIEAKGTKRIYIASDQELISNDYVLDLRFRRKVESFSVAIDADGRPVITEGIVLDGNHAVRGANEFVNGTIRVPRSASDAALMAWSEGDRMWYASMPLRPPATEETLAPSSNVILLWDASGSAVQQDRAHLTQFLQAFLGRQMAWATIMLVPFHVTVESPSFISANGLTRALDGIKVAGATDLAAVLEQLPALVAKSPASRVILVSDGIHSMGDSRQLTEAARSLARVRSPLMVVNASPRANDQFLNMLAASTRGLYLDLTRLSPVEAADRSMRRPGSLITTKDVLPREIATSGPDVAAAWRGTSRVSSFAMMAADGGRRGDEIRLRGIDGPAADLVRRAWARARLRELTDSGASGQEIAGHGRTFGMLTTRTSLIVLESWRDYEMYAIDMPDDVAAQKQLDLRGPLVSRSVTPVFSGTVGWFIKGTVTESSGAPLPGVTVILSAGNVDRTSSITDGQGRFWLAAAAAPDAFRISAELEGFSTVSRAFAGGVPSGAVVDLSLGIAAISEAITVTAEASFDTDDPVDVITPVTSVKAPLRGVQLDDVLVRANAEIETASLERRHEIIAEVLRRMQSFRSAARRFQYYATARSVLGGQKALHIAAAMLLRDDDPDLALRVLTDLAEADANDAPVIRIIARVAQGWGHPDIARRLLQNALEVSPNEPQTWRELILLAASEGRKSELQSLVTRHRAIARDWRMSEVDEQIALEAARGRGSDLRLDPAAAVQVELMFDSNYSYVDLHVVEPSNEEVNWDHETSAQGGRVIGWGTEGFGPQIYTSPGKQRGDYRIDVRYYSGDETEVSAETLAHLIVYARGRFGVMRRTDHVVVLTRHEERRPVTAVHLE
jgi:hypothetical protein